MIIRKYFVNQVDDSISLVDVLPTQVNGKMGYDLVNRIDTVYGSSLGLPARLDPADCLTTLVGAVTHLQIVLKGKFSELEEIAVAEQNRMNEVLFGDD